MDLDELIVGAFCTLDDTLKEVPASRLRTRGPAPVLADSEVLTLEVVGEFLGLDQDAVIYGYFRRHYAHLFPGLRCVHRTTFVRQAANLWAAKEWLWQQLLEQVPHDPSFALVDSFPCRSASSLAPTGAVVSEARPPTARTSSCDRPSPASIFTCGCAGRG